MRNYKKAENEKPMVKGLRKGYGDIETLYGNCRGIIFPPGEIFRLTISTPYLSLLRTPNNIAHLRSKSWLEEKWLRGVGRGGRKNGFTGNRPHPEKSARG